MNARFKRGQGSYKCRCCGKQTRDVNGINGSLELCELCEVQSSYGNQLSDEGYSQYIGGDPWKALEAMPTVQDVHDFVAQAMAKIEAARVS